MNQNNERGFILYKYYEDNHPSIESILRDQKIWYSSAESFNDNKEFKPTIYCPSISELARDFKLQTDWSDLKANRKAKSILKLFKAEENLNQHEYRLKLHVDSIGVLCLSKIFDDPLMWGHYGGRHKGVCFHFDVKVSNNKADTDFGMVQNIIYSSKYPSINYLDILEIKAFSMSNKSAESAEIAVNRYVEASVLTKNSMWGYEKEVRCIKTISFGGPSDRSKDAGDESSVGLHDFNPQRLKGVIFGAESTPEYIEDVVRYIDSSSANSNLYLKRLQSIEGTFELELVDLD